MTYDELQEKYPWLFANPEGCPIQIITDGAERRAIEGAAGSGLERAGLPMEWARTGVVYQDQYLVLLRDAVLFPGKRPGTYLRFCELPPGAAGTAVLPKYGEDLILVRHFRHATRSYHIEIPRGFATAGLSNEENARKELAEEIGATCRTLVALGTLLPNSGMSSTGAALYFATLETIGRGEKAEGIVEILKTSTAELEKMIATDEISDSYTIACYARAKLAGLL